MDIRIIHWQVWFISLRVENLVDKQFDKRHVLFSVFLDRVLVTDIIVYVLIFLLFLQFLDPGFTLSPVRPTASPDSEQSLIFTATPSSQTAYSPSSSPWSSLGHVTPTNLGSFSGVAAQSYASPGQSFLSTSGGCSSFDRVSISYVTFMEKNSYYIVLCTFC